MNRLLIAALILAPVAVEARQIASGTFQVTGDTSLSISSTSTEFEGISGDLDIDTREASLGAAYYIAPNVGIGVALAYDSTKIQGLGFDEESTTTAFGPAVVLNLSLSEQASIFARGVLFRASTETDGADADGFGLQVGGGIAFFPVRHVSLDAGLSYQAFSLENDAGIETDTSGFEITAGISVYFGGG